MVNHKSLPIIKPYNFVPKILYRKSYFLIYGILSAVPTACVQGQLKFWDFGYFVLILWLSYFKKIKEKIK